MPPMRAALHHRRHQVRSLSSRLLFLHHCPTSSSSWADTPTTYSSPFSLNSTQRMHISTMTNSRRKKQTHPSTRFSGSISSFKLPFGGSSSPSAWYLAYHAADGTSHCRYAPHVFPRTPSHPSTLPALPSPFCSSHFLPSFSMWSSYMQHLASLDRWHRTDTGWLHTRALARRPAIPRKRARPVRQHPAFAHRDATRSWRVPQAAHPRADAAALGRTRARNRRQVVPGVRMDTDALWRDRVPRILSRRSAWAVSGALYYGT